MSPPNLVRSSPGSSRRPPSPLPFYRRWPAPLSPLIPAAVALALLLGGQTPASYGQDAGKGSPGPATTAPAAASPATTSPAPSPESVLAQVAAPSPSPDPTPGPPPGPPDPGPVVNPLPRAAVVSSATGPVAPGTLVTLDASETVGDDLDWDSDAPEATYRIDTGKRLVYFSTATPGSYPFKVEAFGFVGGKVRVSKAKVTIVVAGAVPVPVNPPGPTPIPPPTPVPSAPTLTGHLHVSLFYDVNDISVAAFRSSATLRADLAALDCDWYMAATTSPAAQPFNGELSADGTPVVFVQDAAFRLVKDSAGKTLAIKDFKSPADLLAKVKALRGTN